jgi:crotonobetainyl-CoA:carnitine CoA-transferase CaiB-like acyl-CoA transferase
MAGLPLAGIHVIDLSHSWAGPHCGRILADFGAEVIKVEYAGLLCLLRGGRKEEKAYNRHAGWHQVNRNKHAVTLDLHDEQDREVLRELVQRADVVIENSRPGVLDRLGFGYADLRGLKENIILLSMTAFGHTGPYASYVGYGAVMEAVGGIQGLTAYEKGGKPCRIKELDVINGKAGACAVLTALFYRQKTGEGQHIDLSQLEAGTHGLIGEHLLEFAMNGRQTLPTGNRHRQYAPQGCYRCKGDDKWVTLTVRSEQEWRTFCQALGRDEWLQDQRFVANDLRLAHHDPLDRLIEEWTMRHTHQEAMAILQRHGIAAGAVLDVSELAGDPHLRERGYFLKAEDEPAKLFMGMPFRLSKGAGRVRWGGPDLGRHRSVRHGAALGRGGNSPG